MLQLNISDSLHSDAQYIDVSLAALGLWTQCLCYSVSAGCPEYVDRDIADAFTGKSDFFESNSLAEELVSAGLWRILPSGNFEFVQNSHYRIIDNSVRDEWNTLRSSLAPRIYARDGYKCVYCGYFADLTIDHIVPVSRGGTNSVSNLATACRSCNSSKNDKTPEEWKGAYHVD